MFFYKLVIFVLSAKNEGFFNGTLEWKFSRMYLDNTNFIHEIQTPFFYNFECEFTLLNILNEIFPIQLDVSVRFFVLIRNDCCLHYSMISVKS